MNLGFVYAIREAPNGLVKIGWTNDVSERLRSLRTGNPRRLIVVWKKEGTLRDERRMHAQFSKYAANLGGGSEWFLPEVLDHLEEVRFFSAPPTELKAKQIKKYAPPKGAEDFLSGVNPVQYSFTRLYNEYRFACTRGFFRLIPKGQFRVALAARGFRTHFTRILPVINLPSS